MSDQQDRPTCPECGNYYPEDEAAGVSAPPADGLTLFSCAICWDAIHRAHPDRQPEHAAPPAEPPAGVWTVAEKDTHKFTPEALDAMNDGLRRAAAEGKQVVAIEGITLTWRPAEPRAEGLRDPYAEHEDWHPGCSGGCEIVRFLHEYDPDVIGNTARVAATLPQQAALDVERIKRSWNNTMTRDGAGTFVTPSSWDEIAAEYARLAAQEEPHADQESGR